MNVTTNHRSELAHLRSIRSQIPYAAMQAINETLFQVRPREQVEMQRAFDKPTPFVLSGVRVNKATKASLAGSIEIPAAATGGGVVPPGKPLLAEVYGGDRRAKRSERLWQRMGFMPSSWYAVPGPAARMDGYGNMERGQILHLLSFFNAYVDPSRVRGHMTEATRLKLRRGVGAAAKKFGRGLGIEYIVVKVGDRKGGLRPGIYQRTTAIGRFRGHGARPIPVLFFVPGARYVERLKFHDTARDAVLEFFDASFDRWLAHAQSTAR